MSSTAQRAAALGLLVLLAAAVAVAGSVAFGPPRLPAIGSGAMSQRSSPLAEPRGEGSPVGPATLATLPAATFDAVIPRLFAYDGTADTITTRYSIETDIALYGRDRRTPVARLLAADFLGSATTVVGAAPEGDWTLILTPARVTLPSQSGGTAPAQSAAWVRTADVHGPKQLADRVLISVGRQSLTILQDGTARQTFPVGVGTPGTPTPTNTTGYLQQRYLDPRQGETVHPIQLTSLHATAADEPYTGGDGGLIGIHYAGASTGAVSHGCIRVDADAIGAVDELPLGTPVTIVP